MWMYVLYYFISKLVKRNMLLYIFRKRDDEWREPKKLPTDYIGTFCMMKMSWKTQYYIQW